MLVQEEFMLMYLLCLETFLIIAQSHWILQNQVHPLSVNRCMTCHEQVSKPLCFDLSPSACEREIRTLSIWESLSDPCISRQQRLQEVICVCVHNYWGSFKPLAGEDTIHPSCVNYPALQWKHFWALWFEWENLSTMINWIGSEYAMLPITSKYLDVETT